MYIQQKQLDNLKKACRPGRAVIVYGPRRCGKTTLVNRFADEQSNVMSPALKLNGDDVLTREKLSSESISQLRDFVGVNRLVLVDEAQQVPNIGLNLKIIVDNMPDVAVIATGSSSFDLANQISEPLTGRATYLHLFPLAQLEISSVESRLETESRLESRLIYGSYPEIITAAGEEERRSRLVELSRSYLYKDVLAVEGLKRSGSLERLLRLVAFQVGREVSLAELGRQLEVSKNTVDRYLNLLEKCFVLYRLGGFSRNLRNEVIKMPKYYFWDVGVRNAVLGDFNPLSHRNDVGALWENYLVIERAKRREYLGPNYARDYFWRTHTQQEIDLIEDYDGRLHGFEFKWSDGTVAAPSAWRRAYPAATFEVVNRENYLGFIGG
jgi:hypothetical protein